MRYLPKWEMRGYAILWNRFRTNKFTHEQATKELKMKKEIVSIIISDLKRSRWLYTSLDEKDSRKRIYNLVNAKKAWKELLKEMNK